MASFEKEEWADVITELVLDNYVATEKGMTTKEIAEKLECSESTVRKYIDGGGGRLHSYRCKKAAHSKSYPGYRTGSVSVRVYVPGRKFLAEVLKTTRKWLTDNKVSLPIIL